MLITKMLLTMYLMILKKYMIYLVTIKRGIEILKTLLGDDYFAE